MGAGALFRTEAQRSEQPAQAVQRQRNLLGVSVPGTLAADGVPGGGAQGTELLQHEKAEGGEGLGIGLLSGAAKAVA